MKIGYLQFASKLGEPQTNLTRIETLLEDVNLPDLLVLPELCNSGYNFTSHQQAIDTAEEVKSSAFLEFLTSICTKNNIHIVSGFNEREGDDLFNSAVLVGPRGWIGTYRKLHLFNTEKLHFQPGNLGLPVFDIGWCKVGMLVCFDWFFPEAWRVLALKGAEVIGHPSNLVLPGLAQRGVPVHAMINRYYTVTANRTGQEGDLTFTGLSTIASPHGEVLAQAPETGNELRSVEFDPALARDKKITERNHALLDRRPGEYRLLVREN